LRSRTIFYQPDPKYFVEALAPDSILKVTCYENLPKCPFDKNVVTVSEHYKIMVLKAGAAQIPSTQQTDWHQSDHFGDKSSHEIQQD
jgi:hypothetical protein